MLGKAILIQACRGP